MNQLQPVGPVTSTIATPRVPADTAAAGWNEPRADVLVTANPDTGDVLIEAFKTAGLSVGSILVDRTFSREARPHVRAAVKAPGAYEAWRDAVVVCAWEVPYMDDLLDRLVHHRLHRQGQGQPWLHLTASDYPPPANPLVKAPLAINPYQRRAYMPHHTVDIVTRELRQAAPGSVYARVLQALLDLAAGHPLRVPVVHPK